MRSRLQGAFYARAFLGMWYTFAAYLRQFTVRRSHLRKRCGEKERGAMSGSTFVSALSFDSGSPLFSFDSGSPLIVLIAVVRFLVLIAVVRFVVFVIQQLSSDDDDQPPPPL